jgi:hypothetical protein
LNQLIILAFPDELGPISGPATDPESVLVDKFPEFPEFPEAPAFSRVVTEFLELETAPIVNN